MFSDFVVPFAAINHRHWSIFSEGYTLLKISYLSLAFKLARVKTIALMRHLHVRFVQYTCKARILANTMESVSQSTA